jgi:hypothetical protein
MTVIDPETMNSILVIIVAALPVVVAYIKRILNQKGISEDQTDIVLDVVDSALEKISDKYPDNEDVEKFRIKMLKARAIWNDPNTTSEELKDLFDLNETRYVRVLKKTGE